MTKIFYIVVAGDEDDYPENDFEYYNSSEGVGFLGPYSNIKIAIKRLKSLKKKYKNDNFTKKDIEVRNIK